MNLNRENMNKIMGLIAFTILLFVGLQNTGLVISAARNIISLIAPFLIGGCVAFVLSVPMGFFEKYFFNAKKTSGKRKGKSSEGKRVLSLVITLAAVCGVVAVVVFMVAPELYKSLKTIGRELSNAFVRVPELLDEAAKRLPMFEAEIAKIKYNFINVDWKGIGAQVAEFLKNTNFLGNTLSIASSVVSAAANFIIGIVFAIYILLQKENLSRQFRRLFYSFLPEKKVDRFLEVCSLTADSFHSFLSGQCLEAVILGFMFFVSMWVLRLPHALPISVLIGFTALIPIFGAFIGCAVGALLILIVNPIKALWFIVLFLVIQQIEGNVVYPRVVGSSVGLPSIWVFAAVTFGASVGGVLGLLFAIPVCSVVYSLLRDAVRSRIKERKINPEKTR